MYYMYLGGKRRYLYTINLTDGIKKNLKLTMLYFLIEHIYFR